MKLTLQLMETALRKPQQITVQAPERQVTVRMPDPMPQQVLHLHLPFIKDEQGLRSPPIEIPQLAPTAESSVKPEAKPEVKLEAKPEVKPAPESKQHDQKVSAAPDKKPAEVKPAAEAKSEGILLPPPAGTPEYEKWKSEQGK
jgi:hypothetical protein